MTATIEEAVRKYGLAGIHPAATIYRMMNDEERATLAASASEVGWEHPVTVDQDGKVLDGRNRLVVSVDIGLDVPIVTREVTFEEALRFVVTENSARRHDSVADRAEAAARAEVLWAPIRAAARARQAAAGGDRRSEAAKSLVIPGSQAIEDTDTKPAQKSRDEMGELFGVSGATVQRMVSVIEEPDLLDEVRSGRKGIQSAAEEANRRKSQRAAQAKPKQTVTLLDHKGNGYEYAAPSGPATFNSTNESVDWARFTWNPVTGCLHGCGYCYAREIANQLKMRPSYPAGFTPLFHPERLSAPSNTSIPARAADEAPFGRVFVCSMADLFGEWVPEEWISQVFAACNEAPAWEYLFLTKFPKRYKRIDLPPSMWAGASVDTQKRVAGTEAAMRDLDVKVRWLSIEPLLEPLEFSDLSWCDLMVIGAQSATTQPEGRVPAFAPPFRWVSDLVAQADEAGVPVYLKANLLGQTNGNDMPGMAMPKEPPRSR